MNICVCLPTYNEEDNIVDLVDNTLNVLLDSNHVDEFEIIVSDGSSSDKTVDVLEERVASDEIRLIESEERKYYGESIKEGYESTKYDNFVVLEGDGSIHPNNLTNLFPLIEDNDIIVGRRSIRERKPLRGAFSYFYNTLTRNLFNSTLEDHNCGAKVFKKSSCEELFEITESNHWYWDTEILLRAQKENLEVKEIEVTWSIRDNSEVDLLSDSLLLLKKSLKFKVNEDFNMKIPSPLAKVLRTSK